MDTSQKDDSWSHVGGGAVNEKTRQNRQAESKDNSCFDPSTHKAHLWHALEGLDRYPNYLSRLQTDEIFQLEQAMEEKLDQIRQQRKRVMKRRESIEKVVEKVIQRHGQDSQFAEMLQVPKDWDSVKAKILDPKLAKAIFGSQMFRENNEPSIDDVLSGKVQVEIDVALLTTIMDEEMYDVFTFPLFRREFCGFLRSYVDALSDLGREDEFVDLRLGLRPVDLDTVGLKWVNDLLFHLIVRPIGRQLYEKSESLADLDWRQGYVAAYAAKPTTDKPRSQLVTHTDDSEVTLNIGLGKNFEGGHVEFRGLRGTPEGGQLIDAFEPIEGTALIHAGRHFHDVTPVTKGNRYALIVWARSW
eukprot:CAMPEP_0198144230 /NCGR_PEP_ID=MMETSP1443-20131203/14321_1 /TAXON_ID=186043 /ORGANISM="Entomoneis sp., Strain CCMP2396" /LENGTH=357 /DNA_ID=CAMNT_0043807587 /DNA_START=202 /DNA_END=1272 /DNA_ORIENTATION=-